MDTRDQTSCSSRTICRIWALQQAVAGVYGRHRDGRDLLLSSNHQLSPLESCPTDTVVSLPFSSFPPKAAASSLVTRGELAIETFSMGSSYPKEQLEGLELLTVCALLLIMFTITKLQTVLSSLMHLAS